MSQQEPLALRLDPGPSFENFCPLGNEELVATLIRLAQQPVPGFTSLWGSAASGKSHLLQAVCQTAGQAGYRAIYLPLADLLESDPEELDLFAAMDLVGIDDLNQLVGHRPWQEALYRLYNALLQSQGCLLVAASRPAREVPLELADLKSRLGWGPCYQVQELDHAYRGQVLQQRAREWGIDLADESVHFLLTRQQRDLHSLITLLERLDRASLAEQRRLTVPFIREQLQAYSALASEKPG